MFDAILPHLQVYLSVHKTSLVSAKQLKVTRLKRTNFVPPWKQALSHVPLKADTLQHGRLKMRWELKLTVNPLHPSGRQTVSLRISPTPLMSSCCILLHEWKKKRRWNTSKTTYACLGYIEKISWQTDEASTRSGRLLSWIRLQRDPPTPIALRFYLAWISRDLSGRKIYIMKKADIMRLSQVQDLSISREGISDGFNALQDNSSQKPAGTLASPNLFWSPESARKYNKVCYNENNNSCYKIINYCTHEVCIYTRLMQSRPLESV